MISSTFNNFDFFLTLKKSENFHISEVSMAEPDPAQSQLVISKMQHFDHSNDNYTLALLQPLATF